MRIALIAPPFEGSARGLPLGLAHLASMLERHDFEVHALDMTLCEVAEPALEDFITRAQPHVVGISTVCATYLNAMEVASACRRFLGGSVRIVCGGPHVTFAAETVLSRRESVDICVLGEAELTLLELCLALQRPDPTAWMCVPGIAFREGSQIRRSPPRAFTSSLDALPFPARSYFPEHGYLDAIGAFEVGSVSKAEVIASRGCPYPCGFCSTKEFWGRNYRSRSPQHVIAELTFLRERGITDFYFNDDIFTVNRKWVIQLCELLIRADIGIRWACGTRVDRVDRDLLTLMKASGCVYVYYGVESGNELINKGQSKGASVAKIEQAYALLHDVGIYSSAALIFGLPGESEETARATVDWVRDVIRPNEVWISKASCYPGTDLARKYSVGPEDYEAKVGGRSLNGLLYGTGGIYTPFFDNTDVIKRVWEYTKEELAGIDVQFGDDDQEPFVIQATRPLRALG